MIQNFNDLFVELKAKNICKKMVAAWAVDEHTIEAASLATDMGFVKCVLVGDEDLIKKVCADNNIDVAKFEIVDIKDELKAVAQAVKMVHDGEGEVLMKGLCSTDKFLRAILNKETGLLPPKGVLSHVGVIENPNYHKLVFISDMAVIPLPDFRQKVKLAGYLVSTAKSFGIAKPKIAFIAASEQMLDSMPACIEGAMLAKMCDRGQIKGCIGDGPLALDVAIDQESVEIKKLVSPVAGDADCLLFPNIEELQARRGRPPGRLPRGREGALHPRFPRGLRGREAQLHRLRGDEREVIPSHGFAPPKMGLVAGCGDRRGCGRQPFSSPSIGHAGRAFRACLHRDRVLRPRRPGHRVRESRWRDGPGRPGTEGRGREVTQGRARCGGICRL